jgi:hypothetical protein
LEDVVDFRSDFGGYGVFESHEGTFEEGYTAVEVHIVVVREGMDYFGFWALGVHAGSFGYGDAIPGLSVGL